MKDDSGHCFGRQSRKFGKKNNMNSKDVISFLETALSNVGNEYYGSRIDEYMFENNGVDKKHPKRKQLERYLDRYGERVFCYELYHQIRVIMNGSFEQPISGSRISFQAELRKPQIESVTEYYKNHDICPLNKEYVPDFMLHSIGNFENQELVMEVKAKPHLTLKDVQNDLSKIQEFITNYKFKKGVFLSVNSSTKVIHSCLTALSKSEFYAQDLTNKTDIIVIHKQSAAAPLLKWTLDTLPCAMDH